MDKQEVKQPRPEPVHAAGLVKGILVALVVAMVMYGTVAGIVWLGMWLLTR